FVNVACLQGELRVEVLDRDGNVIAPFTKANCRPISIDKTLAAVTWKDGADLARLAGKPVKFRFHLSNGSLYAFWVSQDEKGASAGYVNGGPGFIGPTDTVGVGSYR
ncbi:MAG: glycosyl hydrolase family 32, partial [Verrucomicrobia bacterium]|nr:glycosyl hydrolase family 32 [Verrucomicrobiota bacterium]